MMDFSCHYRSLLQPECNGSPSKQAPGQDAKDFLASCESLQSLYAFGLSIQCVSYNTSAAVAGVLTLKRRPAHAAEI